MAYVPRLKQEYRDKVVSALTEEFSYSNIMQVPKLEKIVLSRGVGAAVADKKLIDHAAVGLDRVICLPPVHEAKDSVDSDLVQELRFPGIIAGDVLMAVDEGGIGFPAPAHVPEVRADLHRTGSAARRDRHQADHQSPYHHVDVSSSLWRIGCFRWHCRLCQACQPIATRRRSPPDDAWI